MDDEPATGSMDDEPAADRVRALREIVGAPPAASSAAARRTMVGNRRRDSHPELLLRRELHRAGCRYRVDFPIRVPGRRLIRPDVVFTRARVAVFVDGCFWHGCPAHGRSPTTNSRYWTAKIALNQERDEQQTASLERHGWRVIRIWEHEPPQEAALRIRQAVAGQAATGSGAATSTGSSASATA